MFTTRPYVPFTLFLPNPFKQYEVDSRQIVVRLASRVVAVIPLPVSAVSRERGLLQFLLHTMFDRGNVVLNETGGHSHVMRRVLKATDFIGAVTSPTILPEPGVHDAALATPSHPELSDCVISIPGMTQDVIFIARRAVHDAAMYGSWEKRAGDWVDADEVLVRYTGFNIHAPASGKVIAVGHDSEFWSEETGAPSTSGYEGEKFFFQLQPTLGFDRHGLMERTYAELITLVENVMRKPKRHMKIISEYSREPESEMSRNRRDLAAFRSFQPRIEHAPPKTGA